MLSNIIRPERKLEVTYGLRFFVDAGGGAEFPCDVNGNVLFDKMTEAAIENYKRCLAKPEKYTYSYNEVHTYRRWVKDEPYGTCHCGDRVYLINEYMGACQCPRCGQWYNLFGEELLPPKDWEDLDYAY